MTAGDRTLRSHSYGYRADGHLDRLTDELGGVTLNFEMDPVGRPLRVTAADWQESYAYDLAGNQTAADWPDRAHRAEGRGERTYRGTRLMGAGASGASTTRRGAPWRGTGRPCRAARRRGATPGTRRTA